MKEAININEYNDQKIDETDIIRRILGGEKELYEILVRRNNQTLYRVIRSYIKDEKVIEDVMQNSYIKAYTKLYQFKLSSSFSTWLVRIGINESLTKLKKRGKVMYFSGDADHSQTNSIIEMPDSRQLNPQEKMMRNEAVQLLENAIDQLDEKYRAVYMLREVEEMSIKEVAASLDLTESNVKVRLHRSKAMLKDIIYDISSDVEAFEFGFSRCDRITENVMNKITRL